MDEKELVFEQYKLYIESKDRFIERSFMANRFYMVVALVLVFALWFLHIFPVTNVPMMFHAKMTPVAPVVVCILGMFSTVLWWINNDAYRFLSKIKLSKVIEVIEAQLPIKPHVDEYIQIKEQTSKKNVLFFGDIQKAFAVVFFIIFVVTLINDVIFFLNARL